MSSNRTVKVTLLAVVDGYVAGFRKARAETDKQAVSAEKAFLRQKQAMTQLGTVALGTSAVLSTAFVAMVKASADFEQRMSQVQALSKATASQMLQLRDAAFSTGAAYGLSATQVADAQIELVKAGVSVKDMLGGALPGALALAAAGQIDVGKATEIATAAMTQFNLKGADVPHVADLLAAGADKSIASVQSLGDALNQSGLVASQFGISVEDTVGVLTAFSKAGLNGSDAGTSFKTMLTQLASPSKQAQALLSKYNITAYDSQGAFVGLTNLAEQLHTKLGRVSQAQRNAALATIFGTDAIRASGVLYDLGGKKLQGFIDGNNEAGFAALQASKKLDNLNGDVQKLGASFQNDLIKSGSAGNDVLRGTTQTVNGLLTEFGQLPKVVQGGTLALVGIGAAVTAAAGGFIFLAPKILEAKAAMADLKLTGAGLAKGFGKGGAVLLGVTAVASGLANLAAQGAASDQQLNLAAQSARGGFKNIDKLFPNDAFAGVYKARDALDYISGGNAGFTKWLDGATFGVTHFSDAAKTMEGQWKAVGEQFAHTARTDYSQSAASFNALVTRLGGGRKAATEALSAMTPYREELVRLATQAGVTATEQHLLEIATGRGGAAAAVRVATAAAAQAAQQMNRLAGSAANARVDISQLEKTIEGFGSSTLNARAAQRAFQQAIDDATAAVKKNGNTARKHGRELDISTQAGRDNAAALDQIASSATAAAGKILAQTGSQKDAADAIRSGRKAFIDAAKQMGLSADAARKLADKLQLIPSNVKTAVSVTGTPDALADVARIQGALDALHNKSITVSVNQDGSISGAYSDARESRAAGGAITGRGMKGVDSVPALLAPGEHVLTDRDVDAMGGQGAVYAFRRQLHGYAKGGAIGAIGAAERDVAKWERAVEKDETAVKRARTRKARSKAEAALKQAETRLSTARTNLDVTRGGAVGEADRKGDVEAKAVIAQNRYLARLRAEERAAKKRAERLQTAYQNIDGTKDNRSRKRAAKAAYEAAKKRAEQAGKRVTSVEKTRDEAIRQRDRFRQSEATLRENREDFVSQQRRATKANPIDPLSYVDQLRSMSRDDNFSAARRRKFDDAANKYEKALVNLQVKSEAAAQKLGELKDASAQMRSSIASAITGGYQASAAGSVQVAGGWIVRDGMQFQTTTSGISADALDSYYSQGGTASAGFTQKLKQLAARGVDGHLLAEIAGYGVVQGGEVADALLSASSGQVASINAGYRAIQANGDAAGATVADTNYAALIADAQSNADRIAKQIADDGEKLRKLIAQAFGLPGYAGGTDSATPGWHWVGEQGPELRRFRGGEQVMTAKQSVAYVRGGAFGSSSTGAAAPTRIEVAMPTTMHLVDADGAVIGRVRAEAHDVATQVIDGRDHHVAVLAAGGAR